MGAGKHEKQADHDGEDETDDLITGERRCQHADGEIGAGQQEAADVSADHYAHIGGSQIERRHDNRESQHEADAQEYPRRQKLAEDRLDHCDR